MNTRTSVWKRLVAAAIVAAGVGVVWGVACGWLFTMIQSMGYRRLINEALTIAYDGTPVISAQSNATPGMSTLSRRTLDGKPWPGEYELWLSGASLRRFELPPGVVQFPIRWNEYGARVGGMTDGKQPPAAWYVVSSDQRAERLYFAGYDPLSKLSIGYIGTEGFRVSLPPAKEQFSITENEPGAVAGRITSTQYVERHNLVRYHNLSAYERPPQWQVFLSDGNRLWEVDLRERTARVVMEVPDTISTGLLNTLESTAESPKPSDNNAHHGRPTPFRLAAMQDAFLFAAPLPTAASQSDAEPPKTRNILVIRSRDQILLYDSTDGNKWQFKLPSEIPPDMGFIVYWPQRDTLLLDSYAGPWSGGSVRDLYWIKPDGAIERKERLELQDYVQPPERRKFWVLSAIMPEPLGWLGAVFGVEPFWRMQYYKASTYSAALRQTLEVTWPMAVIVLVASLAAAIYVQKMHRRYHRSRTGPWTAFVFLLGVPGLVAYWLEHRHAKLESCGECGTSVPRDRDACAACAAPFATPSPVGTEIFA